MSYRLLTEADVAALVDLGGAIEALEAVLGEQGAGQAFPVPKALATWDPRSSMHSLGSAAPAAGYAGFKSWVNTPVGASAIYAVWHAASGRLAVVMEGERAGRPADRRHLRCRHPLAGRARGGRAGHLRDRPPGAGEIVAAVAAVRPIGHVRVWSPDRDHREAFCGRVSERTGLRATAYGTAAEALDGAPVVTLITRATEPFVDAGMLAAGAHVNAVGAILPANAELGGDVFGAAEVIVADDVGNARKASRELIDHLGDDDAAWKAVVRLADVVASGEGRPAGARLTVFKGMGSGLSDLAVAQLALRRAEEAGLRACPRPALDAGDPLLMLRLDPGFLRGSYTPLVTPFRDGAVDEDTYARLTERQIASGSHGVVVAGTTGEPSTLTVAERCRRLLEVAVAEAAAGRVPVIAATGSQSLAETLELSRHAESAGAAAVLVVTPYYLKLRAGHGRVLPGGGPGLRPAAARVPHPRAGGRQPRRGHLRTDRLSLKRCPRSWAASTPPPTSAS